MIFIFTLPSASTIVNLAKGLMAILMVVAPFYAFVELYKTEQYGYLAAYILACILPIALLIKKRPILANLSFLFVFVPAVFIALNIGMETREGNKNRAAEYAAYNKALNTYGVSRFKFLIPDELNYLFERTSEPTSQDFHSAETLEKYNTYTEKTGEHWLKFIADCINDAFKGICGQGVGPTKKHYGIDIIKSRDVALAQEGKKSCDQGAACKSLNENVLDLNLTENMPENYNQFYRYEDYLNALHKENASNYISKWPNEAKQWLAELKVSKSTVNGYSKKPYKGWLELKAGAADVRYNSKNGAVSFEVNVSPTRKDYYEVSSLKHLVKYEELKKEHGKFLDYLKDCNKEFNSYSCTSAEEIEKKYGFKINT